MGPCQILTWLSPSKLTGAGFLFQPYSGFQLHFHDYLGEREPASSFRSAKPGIRAGAHSGTSSARASRITHKHQTPTIRPGSGVEVVDRTSLAPPPRDNVVILLRR